MFSWDLLLNALIAGILLGGFYAAVTVGISISFGILDIVNIAHVAFIILGSYIAYIVNSRFGIDPILVAIIVSLIRTGSITPWLFGNHPMEPPEQPPGYRWSLTLLYLVTAICVVALYGACRWWLERRRAASGRLANPIGAA